jgi:tryptophan 2,3-dioxygenase
VDCVRRDDLGPTFKMLARVSTIQQQLLQSWDVLATITPHDYSAFRNTLGKSSGFQSPQYRMLEFLIGNKNADTIKVFRSDPQVYELLERALRAPSLYDEVLHAAVSGQQASRRRVAQRLSQLRQRMGSL